MRRQALIGYAMITLILADIAVIEEPAEFRAVLADLAS